MLYMDGIGWDGQMGFIGHRSSQSTFVANNNVLFEAVPKEDIQARQWGVNLDFFIDVVTVVK